MRKSHSNSFKAKVALEAIREDQPIQVIAQKYDVHPTMISKWKKLQIWLTRPLLKNLIGIDHFLF